MSTAAAPSIQPAPIASTPTVDMKLEVVIIPVSNVDRAKEFYE